jgi:hypothetical protein
LRFYYCIIDISERKEPGFYLHDPTPYTSYPRKAHIMPYRAPCIYANVVDQFPSKYAAAKAAVTALLEGYELDLEMPDCDTWADYKKAYKSIPCQVWLSKAQDEALRALAGQHGLSLSACARQGLRPLENRFSSPGP